MAKKTVIQVRGAEIKSIRQDEVGFICLTDIAKLKNDIDPNGVIANWMRNRNTIEFLGIWETLYNPNFRICLDFISSLVERCFCADLHCLVAADSGLSARAKREKMPKRTSNKLKSKAYYLLAVKSKQILNPLEFEGD